MSAPRTLTDVVCLGCGCLCDDVRVTVSRDGATVLDAHVDCALGRDWFTRPAPNTPPIGPDHAASARRLAEARAPMISGLGAVSIEAQRLAVAVADRIGATIDAGTPESRARLAATARVGRCSAMLGEVRERADLVLFWACDPLTTHPRHLGRYSAEPIGRFVPEGRAGRHLIVVDAAPNATSSRADATLVARPEHRIAILATLRALLRGASVDASRLVATTGHPLDVWTSLLQRLRSARYGSVFTGAALDDPAEYEALLLLVRDLNQRPEGRFVHLTLGGPGNAAGAEAVLGWQAGFAPDVSFAGGFPERLDSAPVLDRHDLALDLSKVARSFPDAQGGEVMRGDGVILDARFAPGVAEWLRGVLAAMDEGPP